MNKALVIMAAGLASRYGSVKQMDPVGPGNEILMEYAIYDALRAGFDRIIVIIRPEMREDCEQRFAARITRATGIPVEFAMQQIGEAWEGIPISPQRTRPLGTVHALLSARDLIDRPFAVINADDFYGADVFFSIATALDPLTDAKTSAMAAYLLKNTVTPHSAVNRGVCAAENGWLSSITETYGIRLLPDGSIRTEDRVLSPDTYVSMNFWGLHPDLLSDLSQYLCAFLRTLAPEDNRSECLLPTAVDSLISAGVTRTRLLPTDDVWFGLTTQADRPDVLAALRDLRAAGVYPQTLWQTE
ncbi:MAG: NTP transferase domain-containing protein [Oscillospiraceae bacterium]|nr:NTP transferase domain-containing protein [Oscillospiraceae bacterium]